MRKEFHKIILSILCQAITTTLIKLIIIVRLEKREDLKNNFLECTLKSKEDFINKILKAIENFRNEMLIRRLIGASIMLICLAFFFFYSVAFCGIYIKTQKNWFYAGIWSLFLNWFLFSPIFIIIISLIEYTKQNSFNQIVYYLKRLFCF